MTHPIGYRPLLNNQPDILHQGNVRARNRHRALSEIDFLERNIRLQKIENRRYTDNPPMLKIGRGWLKSARARLDQLYRQEGVE